jgi:hypothetical protein
VGGPYDGSDANNTVGAAWAFTRSGPVWYQGGKLVGSGAAVGGALQGWSVALSADGNTAIVGGPYDNYNNGYGTGAAWAFTRSGGVWSPLGGKLVGSGGPPRARSGFKFFSCAFGFHHRRHRLRRLISEGMPVCKSLVVSLFIR